MALVGAEIGCSRTVSSVAQNVTAPHVRFLRVLDETLPIHLRMAWRPTSDNPACLRSSPLRNASGPAVPTTQTRQQLSVHSTPDQKNQSTHASHARWGHSP